MDKMNQAPATKPKVVLIVASALCLISAFLPWLGSSSAGSVGFIFVTIGLILLVLNILALALKKKATNLTSNILGIVGGIVALIYSGAAFFGTLLLDAFDHINIGLLVALLSSVLLFVVSIVSIKKDKKQSRKE